MNLKIWGPIIFSVMVFIISGAIKVKILDSYNAWLELPPQIGIWAAGILFSLAVSEETKFGGKAKYETKKQSGTSIVVDYSVSLPEKLEFSAKYVYLLVFAMMIWILTILINGHVAGLIKGPLGPGVTTLWTWSAHLWNLVGFSLSGTALGSLFVLFMRCPNECFINLVAIRSRNHNSWS